MKRPTEIRWGVIGCGDVTEVKSGPALQKTPHSKLVAVMRRSANLAADYARRHNVPAWYDDAEKLINDPQVNAVYIATPPSSHKAYTIAAANAGKPVYVEKPMSVSYADCREMIAACQKNGVPLFVAYYRRAQPRFLKVKELLDNGAIGTVRYATVTLTRPPFEPDVRGEYHWRIDPSIAGCGYFCDLAAHTIDLLNYYLGNCLAAQGMVERQSGLYLAEDAVSAIMSFPGGVQCSGIWNFNAHETVDRNEIAGSTGKITFSTFADAPVVLENSAGRQVFELSQPQHVQQPLIESVVAALLGKGKCPSTGETAARTNRVIDQILR